MTLKVRSDQPSTLFLSLHGRTGSGATPRLRRCGGHTTAMTLAATAVPASEELLADQLLMAACASREEIESTASIALVAGIEESSSLRGFGLAALDDEEEEDDEEDEDDDYEDDDLEDEEDSEDDEEDEDFEDEDEDEDDLDEDDEDDFDDDDDEDEDEEE